VYNDRVTRTCAAALVLLALSSAQASAARDACARPVRLDDGWQSEAPEASGFDPQTLCAVLASVADGDANIHGLIVERHGRLVAELYRRGTDRSIWTLFAREQDFGPEVVHDLRSVTKSVVSLLFGIARQQRGIDLTASPLAFYPEYASLRSPERDAITLEHLLTMSSGLEWREAVGTYGTPANDETRLYWDWAPYRYVLGRPVVAPPGSRFNYNGGGTAVLADIVRRETRMPLRDFARTALFEPLGIRDWTWVRDPYRREIAFAGLRMRPRDLAKVGRMVLARGEWQGRRIVPADWIAASLAPHIATGDGLEYGYQWWTGTVEHAGRALRWSAGFGNGGQRLFLVPALDVSVVITAGAYNDPGIGRAVGAVFREVVASIRD
jgi:CubicO group peptidase (beta-lactamase class C family)